MGGCHIVVGSSSAKPTALRVAASLVGPPEYARVWRSAANEWAGGRGGAAQRGHADSGWLKPGNDGRLSQVVRIPGLVTVSLFVFDAGRINNNPT
ncbi:DUF927 domain-containing protein [Stenotrophomonas bentonitica]|uniref:DUF927 domain-containing protein n=1 Tax=Stenotrophomonas bentonitica TaxID=1450134 RepID=UPI0037D93BE0